MPESMCKGCAYLITKGVDGTMYQKKHWYCAKLWNRSEDLEDAKYICNKKYKKDEQQD